jgi:MFS family permease
MRRLMRGCAFVCVSGRVFVSRTFYYMAVSVQIYILYYLRDTMKDPEISNNAQKYTAILCVLSQGSSGVVACVAGSWCDGFGRKPLIYLSCVAIALVYVGYCFIDSYTWVLVLGVFYGASNGVYLAVDYALAVECLPNADDHAKDLALWGIAAFLGTMFGPCISGPLLSFVGQQLDPSTGQISSHYSFRGYMALMITGVVYSLLCGVVVTRVSRGNSHMTIRDLGDTSGTQNVAAKPAEAGRELEDEAIV